MTEIGMVILDRGLKMISIDRTKFSKILSKFCFQFFAQFSYVYSIHSRRRSRERKRTSIINSEETRSIDFTSRSFVPPFSILLSTLCHCLHSSLQLAFFFFSRLYLHLALIPLRFSCCIALPLPANFLPEPQRPSVDALFKELLSQQNLNQLNLGLWVQRCHRIAPQREYIDR